MTSSRDSHTSDLIKRFEALSPKAPTKPATLVRRGAAATPAPLVKQQTDDDTSSSAIATLSAAQSALSAAIAHTQTPPTPKWQRPPPYAAATSNTQPTSMPAPSRIGASLSVSPLKHHHGGLTNNGGMVRASTFNVAPARHESEIIASLNKRAVIDEDLQMPTTMWIEYAESCIDDGQHSQQRGDCETAYLKYMTACNVFSVKLQPACNSSALAGNLKFAKLRTSVNSWISDELNSLRDKLDSSSKLAAVPQTRRSSINQLGQSMRQLDSFTTNPSPAESSTRVSYSLAERRLPVGSSTVVSRLHPPESSLPKISIIDQHRGNRHIAVAMSPELPEFDEKLAGSESIGMFDEDVAEKLRSQAASRAESNASSATDLSSMLSYHAPADGRPRPPAYQPTHTSRSQSRGSVNSNDTQDSDPVLDFMQRNGGICPPQQGSRRPTAQNSTPAGVGQVPAYKGFAEIDLPLPVATAELRPRHRPPPPLPLPVLPVRPQLPPQTRQPTSFSAIRNFVGRAPPPNAPLPYRPSVPLPVHTLGSEYGDDDDDMYDQRDEPLFTPNGTRLYSHHNAVGSDPALSGRMQSGSNPRSSAAYEHSAALSPGSSDNHAGGTFAGQSRRISQISDSGVFGVTGLKNFGNTCFMNSVIQCLIGTKPLTRYFMRGEWRKDLVKDNPRESDVTSEFSKVVESMWRGQYSSISPADFRASVAKCSEQFRGNEQEDAHEFASFLLNTLHETLNHRHPKPPPEKERTFEEELEFEQLSDEQQSDVQWELYTRRNHSIVTSIFQGQIQSRLTCMACQHTSTTYHTFTELSVPIPEPGNSNSMGSINGNSMGGINGPSANTSQGPYALPVNIYQCLDAYSETELLDGDNMWMCPQCKTKRTATKQLMIARLPLVLIIHLKRFSTIGHFREKLETNVLIPTLNLCLQKYVTFEPAKQSTTYNLYAVANHFGSMSSGHYTASVSDGMDSQWNSFDDTRASQIHESQVTTPAAYLLFFVRTRPD